MQDKIPDSLRALFAKIADEGLYSPRQTGVFLDLGPKAMEKRRRLKQPPDYVKIGTKTVKHTGAAIKAVLLAGAVTCG